MVCSLASPPPAKTLGQLMALGNYPSYLKPFVFSWPTGQLYSFLAAKRAAVADTTTGVSLEFLISSPSVPLPRDL